MRSCPKVEFLQNPYILLKLVKLGHAYTVTFSAFQSLGISSPHSPNCIIVLLEKSRITEMEEIQGVIQVLMLKERGPGDKCGNQQKHHRSTVPLAPSPLLFLLCYGILQHSRATSKGLTPLYVNPTPVHVSFLVMFLLSCLMQVIWNSRDPWLLLGVTV